MGLQNRFLVFLGLGILQGFSFFATPTWAVLAPNGQTSGHYEDQHQDQSQDPPRDEWGVETALYRGKTDFKVDLDDDRVPPQDDPSGRAWSCCANAAARMMVTCGSYFPVGDYEKMKETCPKTLDPGRPIHPAIRSLLRDKLAESRLAESRRAANGSTENLFKKFFDLFAQACLETPGSSCILSSLLPPIGASATDLAHWMNDFRSPYQIDAYRYYVAKGEASFEQIITELSHERPVMALILLGHQEMPASLLQTATDLGIENMCPKKMPILHWVVVTGFNRETGRVTYRDTDGSEETVTYTKFIELWDWTVDHHILQELFALKNVTKRTLIVLEY